MDELARGDDGPVQGRPCPGELARRTRSAAGRVQRGGLEHHCASLMGDPVPGRKGIDKPLDLLALATADLGYLVDLQAEPTVGRPAANEQFVASRQLGRTCPVRPGPRANTVAARGPAGLPGSYRNERVTDWFDPTAAYRPPATRRGCDGRRPARSGASRAASSASRRLDTAVIIDPIRQRAGRRASPSHRRGRGCPRSPSILYRLWPSPRPHFPVATRAITYAEDPRH